MPLDATTEFLHSLDFSSPTDIGFQGSARRDHEPDSDEDSGTPGRGDDNSEDLTPQVGPQPHAANGFIPVSFNKFCRQLKWRKNLSPESEADLDKFAMVSGTSSSCLTSSEGYPNSRLPQLKLTML